MASSCKLELSKFSTLLRIQDRAKCGKGTELHWGGDTAQKYLYWKRGGHCTHLLDEWNKSGGDTTQHWKKAYTGRGGHRTYFVGVGTPHNIYKKSLAVGGWSKPENNATLWLHLSSWNFTDSQFSWESKMESSVAKKETYTQRGDTAHTFLIGGTIWCGGNIYWWEGGTLHILCWWRNNWGGDTA